MSGKNPTKKDEISEIEDHFTGRAISNHKADYFSETESIDRSMAHDHFKAISGITLDYYGADTGIHAFKIDQIVFKVLEDPSDGYRSYLGAIDYTDSHASIFFSRPIAKVQIKSFSAFQQSRFGDDDDVILQNGYRLVDIDDNHIWLEFGTDFSDDYYPYFIFRHYPKLKEKQSG